MIRVIQWATGGVGRAAIETILDHPELELAGAWVHGADKVGTDLGTLIGRDPIGVAASTDAEALLATDADCVLYSPLMADGKTLRAILASGKNVVTPLGWFYPDAKQRERYDALCREHGVTLHGTGIHPGGITEKIPLALTALSGSVTAVRAEEFSDIRTYAAPDVVRYWMKFGGTPEEATSSGTADALGSGYRQSVYMIADALGVDLDPELRVTHEAAVATAPIESPIGVIEPGQVAAQRLRWQGTVDGEPVITAAVNWFMGEAALDPPWEFGAAGERYEIEIAGDPGSFTTIAGMHAHSRDLGAQGGAADPGGSRAVERHPGIVATAAHCVNSIPYVVAADPGVRTYLDLPLTAGRAAPHLHRAHRSDRSPAR
ncbi:dihydrodipicolinate reductase [Nocardia sp. NPDC050697]|uniref:NAD(P)H-dependent amine dehydrogenase family protein n=1 Tax=Nocardia sp. NPDC050697 TaxID=3155158 RepID=UPI00340F7C95